MSTNQSRFAQPAKAATSTKGNKARAGAPRVKPSIAPDQDHHTRYAEAQAAYMKSLGLASGTRHIIATVVSFVIAFSGGYFAGYVFTVAYIAAILLGAWAFIAYILAMLATLTVVFTGVKVSWVAYKTILEFDTKPVTRFFSRCKAQVVHTSAVVTDRTWCRFTRGVSHA